MFGRIGVVSAPAPMGPPVTFPPHHDGVAVADVTPRPDSHSDRLEDLVADVEVGPDVLHVIQVLQDVDEP